MNFTDTYLYYENREPQEEAKARPRRSEEENKMYSFFDDVWNAWESVFKTPSLSYGEHFPPANVITDMTGCVIELALAGYSKDQLKVEVNGDVIIVSGVEKSETEDDKRKYHSHRIKTSSFKRAYRVPEDYDLDALESSYVDGVLSICIPLKKIEEARPKTRSIPIN